MSNELEFRVWDKKSKKFVEGKYLSFIPNLDGIYKFDCSQDFCCGEIPDQYPLDYVFQLYTGLKDKKVVKIFEGDIVTVDNSYRGYINYCIERACYRVLGKLSTEIYQEDLYFLDSPIKYPKGIHGNGRTCKIDHNRIDVIGNIFQNSELLK